MAFATEAPAGHRLASSSPSHHEWHDADWLAAPGGDRLARGADVDLRGAPRRRGGRVCPTPSWPSSWSTTSPTPASPTSSSCRSPSTRSAGRGATRSRRTTRRPPASARPTSSATSSTRCTRPASACIVDWVPAHFPKDDFALARFDGTALYEHADPRRGEQPDWGTYVFDFGRSEVRNFLVANALFWLEEFHVDGLRVDAVASMLYLDYSRKDGEWLPNELRRPREPRSGGVPAGDERDRLQAGARRDHDRRGVDVLARASPGRRTSAGWASASSGTWAGCTTRSSYITHEPIHRQYHHNELTFSMMYAYTENFVLPISHDEVVHGKGSLLGKIPGDRWQQMATCARFLRLHVGPSRQAAAVHGPGVRPGRRVGREPGRWTGGCSTARTTGASHALVSDLNRAYRDTRRCGRRTPTRRRLPLDRRQRRRRATSTRSCGSAPDGSVAGLHRQLLRYPHENYRLGLPQAGRWDEVVNTDADGLPRLGRRQLRPVVAEQTPWHGQPASATMVRAAAGRALARLTRPGLTEIGRCDHDPANHRSTRLDPKSALSATSS